MPSAHIHPHPRASRRDNTSRPQNNDTVTARLKISKTSNGLTSPGAHPHSKSPMASGQGMKMGDGGDGGDGDECVGDLPCCENKTSTHLASRLAVCVGAPRTETQKQSSVVLAHSRVHLPLARTKTVVPAASEIVDCPPAGSHRSRITHQLARSSFNDRSFASDTRVVNSQHRSKQSSKEATKHFTADNQES
jgi:hypothetical protein